MSQKHSRAEGPAYRFIQENIDSVPQIEGLILLWESRPEAWTAEELAVRLYVSAEQTHEALRDLTRIGMVEVLPGATRRYCYLSSSPEQDELMKELHATYRQDLIRVSHMIHSKTSSAVREFARAFRLKKERER